VQKKLVKAAREATQRSRLQPRSWAKMPVTAALHADHVRMLDRARRSKGEIAPRWQSGHTSVRRILDVDRQLAPVQHGGQKPETVSDPTDWELQRLCRPTEGSRP